MQPLQRRTFLAGGLATSTLAFTACGTDPESSVPLPNEELSILSPTFPDGFRAESVLVAGTPQRVAFVVRDEIDFMRASAPDSIRLRISSGGTTVFEDSIARRSEGIITPYYPVEFTFDSPGEYVAGLPGFPDVPDVPFLVLDRDAVSVPQAGDPMPLANTPTFDDDRGVEKVCTRAQPCRFHELDLAEALANGKPTVLLIATPGFCQTDICGPVVDLLIDEAGQRDDLNVIHAEVYVNPSVFSDGRFPDTTSVVAATALPFEPSLFVIDEEGTVVTRVDTTFDRSELREALALV